MDLPNVEAETNGDYTFLYFIYGFLALLGFCFVFSVGKVIYHYYKVRMAPNVAAAEESIYTECHSISNEPSASERQMENSLHDSNRLCDQLDKLRRLLNRLNAMGTFSRDTIGDLSAQSAAYVNKSVAASSDLSEFWSSIDFDDFEESTINEGIFQKSATEKSISPSVSDFSLDTSTLQFDNFRQKNIATSSRENNLNVSAFNCQISPSDAIVQILSILDSIMQKNRINAVPLQNNTVKVEKNLDKFTNFQSLSRSANSVESYASQKRSSFSSSIATIDKNLYSRCESFNSDTLISTTGYINSENLNTETKVVDMSVSKHNCFDQLSQFIDSHYRMSSTSSMCANISKGMSAVNITSASASHNLYSSELLTSSKSLDTQQIAASVPVAIRIDPRTCLSSKVTRNSESLLDVRNKPHLLTNEIAKKMLPEERAIGISYCGIDIEGMDRSHSFSDLLSNRSQTLSVQLGTEITSDQKKSESTNYSFEKNTLPVITITESHENSRIYSTKINKILNEENPRHKSRTPRTNNSKFSSISSKSLHSPVFSDAVTIKSSVSDSEIKQSPLLERLSSNLSSSGSDAFLSPVNAADLSQYEKVLWKSPVEPNADVCESRNLTPHNVNAVFSRKSCIWSTPPSPEETTACSN